MKKLISIALSVICTLSAIAQDYYIKHAIPYRDNTADEYTSRMCNLDVATFKNADHRPVVVWFHGGGLTSGEKEVPQALLSDSLIVVGVGYRLSPHADIPDIIDDAAAAIAWTFRNIDRYGGNRSKIFIAGHSAGGYLIDMIGLDKSHLGRYGIDADTLAGIIPFSGQVITHFELRNRRGLQPLQPTVDEYAPLFHVRGDCPPILIISGDREKELFGRYEEQAYLWRMLKLNGHNDVTLYELDGYDHGGMAQPAFPLLIDFINHH